MKQRIINISTWISVAVAAVALLAFAERRSAAVTCKALVVAIVGVEETPFVTNEEIAGAVASVYPQLLQTPVAAINTQLLEEHLNSLEAVKNAEVFSKLDGRLWVEVEQRKPIARIMAERNYYLDEAGQPMHLSGTYAANVVLISGFELGQHHQDLLHLVRLLQENTRLSGAISGIERRANGEYVLFPAIGQHKVLLGGLANAEKRLKKLAVFYAHGMETAWDQEVAWINLKYKDQVIIKNKGYGN